MARAEAPQVPELRQQHPGHTACPNCGTYTTRSGKEIVVKAEA